MSSRTRLLIVTLAALALLSSLSAGAAYAGTPSLKRAVSYFERSAKYQHRKVLGAKPQMVVTCKRATHVSFKCSYRAVGKSGEKVSAAGSVRFHSWGWPVVKLGAPQGVQKKAPVQAPVAAPQPAPALPSQPAIPPARIAVSGVELWSLAYGQLDQKLGLATPTCPTVSDDLNGHSYTRTFQTYPWDNTTSPVYGEITISVSDAGDVTKTVNVLGPRRTGLDARQAVETAVGARYPSTDYGTNYASCTDDYTSTAVNGTAVSCTWSVYVT